MDSLRRFGAIVGADLLERTRSTKFWVIQTFICIASWWSFPTMDKGYVVLAVNGHLRGEYSSAWIGMVVGMLSVWLSLIGFYLVRGTLVRDFETRVWQLVVATPLTRSAYLLAKWCSNMAVLLLVLAGALAVGLVAQLVRGESSAINLVELVKPALFLAIPSLAITALLALVFDLVPWLRRTAGNVIFFIVWLLSLAATLPAMTAAAAGEGGGPWLGDPRGMVVFQHSLARQVAPQLQGEELKTGFCMVCVVKTKRRGQFAWSEWQQDGQMMAGRLLWLLLAIGGVLLCAPWLDRAAANIGATRADSSSGSGRTLRLLDWLMAPFQHSQLGVLVAAEMQMALRQRPAWWWMTLLGTAGAGMLAPMPAAALAVIGGWALLLDRYGQAALHERTTRTGPLVFSAPWGGGRVLHARLIVLFVLGVVLNLPAVLRFAVTQPTIAVAIIVVSASLPAWSLAIGALTGNPRTFELLACVFGYLALNGVAVLHVGTDPGWTALVHVVALPAVILVAAKAWRAMSQR